MAALEHFTDYASNNPSSTLFRIPKNLSSQSYIASLSIHSAPYSKAATESIPAFGLMPNGIHHDFVLCALQHPETSSCEKGALIASAAVAIQVLKSYTILNGASFLFGLGKWIHAKIKSKKMKKNEKRNGKKMIRGPKDLIFRFIVSTARSCIMLISFVSLFSYSLCTIRRLTGREFKASYKSFLIKIWPRRSHFSPHNTPR